MNNNNDYIDELNWYTGDFDVETQRAKVPRKEKTSTSSSHSKSSEKEKRLRRTWDSPPRLKHSSTNKIKYVDLDAPSRKSEVVFRENKPLRKSSHKNEISVARPLKREKPDIKLYEPIKISSRGKDVVSVKKSASKSIEKASKSDIINPFGKTEPVKMPEPLKMPEPILSNFTKAVVNNKSINILTEKLALLEERDKLIRSSMDKPSNLKQARSVKGTCPDMCPEKERLMRSLKKMISVFECQPNSNEIEPKLAIKEYARSSADQEEPLPHELRPEPVLTMSMSYIITRIITKFEECEDVSVWYDFCWNRLRAIRKDIVQQQLCDLETVTIVEQCARFHIVCFDRFWGADSSMFDEKINTENLMNCLKILLNLYGDLRKQGVFCPNEPEFNAYMILIKMNSGDLLWEFLNFPLSLQQTPLVIEAVKIHMFYNSNMHSQFFNYLLKTSYLNACLMQRCFTQLRVNALEVIVKAYCPPNKEGKVSLQHIMKSLKFDSKEDALLFCKSCNIRYIDRMGFKISHNTFMRPNIALKILTPSSLVCSKRVDFAQAVVGIDNEMPIYIEHTVHNSFLNEKTLHPDALDASDQEEKMLRDTVERKLIMKNLKNSPVKVNQSKSSINTPTTPILQRSLSSLSNRRQSVESDVSSTKLSEKPLIFSPEPEEVEDIEMEELSESEDYDMPDALSELGNTDGGDDSENVFVDADNKDSLESKEETDLGINFDWDPMWQVSPLSAISDEPLESVEEEEPFKNELLPSINQNHERISPPPNTQFVLPLPSYSRTTSCDDSVRKNSTTSPPTPKVIERRLSVSSNTGGETKITPYLMKLKNKLKLNLQRLSAKKYGRIWRERVREIKKSYGFVPLVSHMNMKEYLTIWGRSVRKQSTILNQLNNSKKFCSSVDSLLLFNMFDTSTKNLCCLVSESLVGRKLRERSLDSVNWKDPIYWKLVISVPESKVSNYDLYQKVLAWSEQIFFSSETARKTRIETTFCKGIKVHCKIVVTEGGRIESGQNLSALIFLNVPGWETDNESQTRLDQFISILNHPIPIYIINLAPSSSPLVPPSKQQTTFFSEISAGSKTLLKILTDLALNSYQMTVKSMHICDLVDEMLDKFLDALQEDCFNSVEFSKAISNPSNIIYLYDILIDKLKSEIVQNYKTNIYGTSNEIISTVTPNLKYNIRLLPKIIGEYFDSLTLNKLQWPPKSSYDLLHIFKQFCDESGIPQVLSQVIRMINPPDDSDTSQMLFTFLYQLKWLQIIEVIIKGYFRTKFCDIVVTYSQKSINDLIDSHWWMECNSILKCT